MDSVKLTFTNNNIFLDPTTMVALPNDVLASEVVNIPKQQISVSQAAAIKELLAQS